MNFGSGTDVTEHCKQNEELDININSTSKKDSMTVEFGASKPFSKIAKLKSIDAATTRTPRTQQADSTSWSNLHGRY